MKKITFCCGVFILLAIGFAIGISKKQASSASSELVVSCNAKVDFEIRQPDAVTHMEGSLSLATLGSKRMALLFSGRLVTPEGRFILNRTLLMDYQYHPENHLLELAYDRSSVSDLDTAPNDVFYHRLLQSKSFILYLTRFSDRAWLLSGLTVPLYVCNDN